MPMVRCGNTNSINVFPGQQIAEIIRHIAVLIPVLLVDRISSSLTGFGLYVTDGDHPAIVLLKKHFQIDIVSLRLQHR